MRNNLGLMECADCGMTTIRRNVQQRYCPGCSGVRDEKRKADWARRHGKSYTPADLAATYVKDKSAIQQVGAERSLSARTSLGWSVEPEPIYARQGIRVAVPFSYASSKNAHWRTGRGGHIYANAESRSYREQLAKALSTGEALIWYKAKLWVDIFVEKPNHRGDAGNVVDLVFDAVQDATGVNDRWYSLVRLDWSIVKVDPRLIVGLRQEADQDHRICSHCGKELPATTSYFARNRSAELGLTRACKACTYLARRQKSEASHR